MKAVFFEEHGEIDVLKFAEIPDPKPKHGEALVKVKAVALNHLDIWVRKGWKGLNLEMPHITGSDVVGEIVSVNAASSWAPGARVIVNPGINTVEDEWTRRGEHSVSPGYKILGEQIRGGMAEYVCVPASNVFMAPERLSDEELAAPILVGTTCWRMLFKAGQLQPGQSVLVVGAGGGVNSLAIQLAHAIGCRVYVVAGGPEKVKNAEKLGARAALDYKLARNWHVEILKLTKGRGVDLVVDNVGAATIQKSLRAVARGGKIVTVGNTSGPEISYDNRIMFSKQISIVGSTMGSPQDFQDAMNFIWRQGIKPVIDTVTTLDQGIDMVRRMEAGEHFGKIVLKP